MRNQRLYCAWYSFMALCVCGCNTGTLFPVSDVPCFQPTAWSPRQEGAIVRVRPIPGVEGAILITNQTFAQRDNNHRDDNGMIIFISHDPVYRFSPDTGVIELVDDSVWDDLTTRIGDCSIFGGDISPFDLITGSTGSLSFGGEEISVAGGAIEDVEGAPESAVVAVVSTDGSVRQGVPFVPVTLVEPSGQYFHQLFSKLDGSPVGDAVRLGVRESRPCWTYEETYVLYEGNNPNGERTVCIVPIEDELPKFGN